MDFFRFPHILLCWYRLQFPWRLMRSWVTLYRFLHHACIPVMSRQPMFKRKLLVLLVIAPTNINWNMAGYETDNIVAKTAPVQMGHASSSV